MFQPQQTMHDWWPEGRYVHIWMCNCSRAWSDCSWLGNNVTSVWFSTESSKTSTWNQYWQQWSIGYPNKYRSCSWSLKTIHHALSFVRRIYRLCGHFVLIAVNRTCDNLEQADVVTTRTSPKLPVVRWTSVPDVRAISVLKRSEKNLLCPLKNPRNFLKKDLDWRQQRNSLLWFRTKSTIWWHSCWS
jgi:hypothetical protein